MSEQKLAANVFKGQMDMNSLPEDILPVNWSFAFNAVNKSVNHTKVFTNELSNKSFKKIDGKIIGWMHLKETDHFVLFVAGKGSSIYLLHTKTGETTHVITDSDFGCSWGFGECEYLYGCVNTVGSCNDRVLVFSSRCIYYRVNIDELLSERKKCIPKDDCEYFKLIRCVCGPNLAPIPVDGGGFLRSGKYQFFLQLEDNDGNTTNPFPISDPVAIGSENNIPGEITNRSIRLYIDSIQRGYSKVNIFVVKTIAGSVLAEKLISRPTSEVGFVYDYYGDNPDAVPVNIEQALLRPRKYIEGTDLVAKDGKLWLFGIKPEFNLNYQKYANEIGIRIHEVEVPYEIAEKYNLPTLMRGEVYSWAIWPNYCDGTTGLGFHIGMAGTTGGGGNSGGANSPTGDPPILNTFMGIPIKKNSQLTEATFIPAPTVESFETNFGIWENEGEAEWQRSHIPTPTPGTGPASGNSSAIFVYAKSLGNIGKSIILRSPSVDLTQSKTPYISFDYHMLGTDVSSLELQASIDGQTFHSIWSASDNQGDTWKSQRVNLSRFNGVHLLLQFKTVPKGNQGDIALDNIVINNAVGDPSQGGAQVQYDAATYDTSNSFKRKRNPASPDDNLETALDNTIDNIGCDEQTAKDGIDKYGDFFNVDELGDCYSSSLDAISNSAQNAAENIASKAQDERPSNIEQTVSIKTAAKHLLDKGVRDREYIEQKAPVWSFDKGGAYRPGNQLAEPPTGEPATQSVRSDNWTDGKGKNLIEVEPKILRTFVPKTYESTVPYPDICDCDGQRMFPEGNIKHPRMPTNCESSHYISNQVGVPHKHDKTNDPFKDVYVRLLVPEFYNIYIPKDEELTKKLCPNRPFTIGITKRDLNDRSIIAKGLVTPCFTGVTNGREYAYQKHGVASFECVDVSINDNGSHIGTNSSPNAYTFHSLDTDSQHIPLPVENLITYLELFGSGWRWGLYAEGKPPELPFTGKRVDQRGARQGVNLSGQLCSLQETNQITGITYAPGDQVITPPPGISLPLNNRHRESAVYFQTQQALPPLQRGGGKGPESDQSFIGDVLDHEAPILTAASWYSALTRNLPDQYGSVEGLKYISTGITGLERHNVPGSRVTVWGITGDVYIGFYTFKRSGYVSDKVGDLFPVANGSDDGRVSSWKRDRAICDLPDDLAYQDLAMNHWSTRLPLSGDVSDAKNWAGLHTTNVTYSQSGAAARTAPDSDFYYPRLQKTAVIFCGEFEMNPYLRSTGVGSQIHEGKVYWGKLKDLYLDANDTSAHPWEESWVPRHYARVEQPSKSQIARKIMIRALLALILPALGVLLVTQLESIPDSILTVVVYPLIAAYLMYANITLFSDDWLNKIVGIPICKTDSEGGENEYIHIVGYEDNYTVCHLDYSTRNELDVNFGLPSNYNTCRCDDCKQGGLSKFTPTKQIYHSAKQILNSNIDSWRNFKAFQYEGLPAHAGPIKDVFVESNRFYAQTTDGLHIIQYNNEALVTDNVSLIIGRGGLLSDPQMLREGASEGHLGLLDRNSAINTAYGRFWIGREECQVLRLFNGQVTSLDMKGEIGRFLSESLHFCHPTACMDEMYTGTHYALGFDPVLGRLLVTKIDGTAESSWTASYDIEEEKWISFHGYLPNFYMWTRGEMFTVTQDEVWIHNQRDVGSYHNFFGKGSPFIVDFVLRLEDQRAFSFYSLMVNSSAQLPAGNDFKDDRHLFFDKIGVWNGSQGSGLLPIITQATSLGTEENLHEKGIEDRSKVKATYQNNEWRVNGIGDYINDCDGTPITRASICSPMRDLVSQKPCDDETLLHGRYLNVRLQITDSVKFQMYLKSVQAVVNKSIS